MRFIILVELSSVKTIIKRHPEKQKYFYVTCVNFLEGKNNQ